MAQLKTEEALRRADQAWTRKDLWRSMLEDAYEFALPQRNLLTTFSEGAEKMDRVFDSTAVQSTIAFANNIQTELTPAFQTWAELRAGPFVPDQAKDRLNDILQDVTKRIFAAIHTSNFDTVIGELYLDLAVGTGSMLILQGDDRVPIRFVAVPNAQIAIEDGPFSTVGAVYRRYKLKAYLIEEQWPDSKPLDNRFRLTREIEQDRTTDVDIDEITYFDRDINQWRYEVIVRGTTTATISTTQQPPSRTTSRSGQRIVERVFRKNPWVIVRWIKVPGETQGRGPLLTALPDIRTVNAVVELILRNAALAITGVYTAVDDGTLNPDTVAIIPGAVIPVQRNDGPFGPSLAELPSSRNFDVSQFVLEDMRGRIKAMLMDKGLPEETAQPKSATEIIERVRELQQDIGAPFGRLFTELIVPTMERVIEILVQRGIIEDIPVDGLGVKVQVTSPLARVQELNDIEVVVRWLELQNAALGQELMMLATKVEDLGAWLGNKLGVDNDLIRDDRERSQLQQQAGQMVAQQQTETIPGTAAPASPPPLALAA